MPVPGIVEMSMSCSRAMRRTSGELRCLVEDSVDWLAAAAGGGTAARKELLVAGPTLGRKVGNELVFYAEGEDGGGDRQADFGSFTPLLVQFVNEPMDLIFLTDTCFVGSSGAVRRVEQLAKAVQRDLSNETGSGLTPIQPVPIDLEGQGKVRCQSIVDVLPSSALTTGDFVFAAEVAADKKGGVERGEVRFAVELTDEGSEPQ